MFRRNVRGRGNFVPLRGSQVRGNRGRGNRVPQRFRDEARARAADTTVAHDFVRLADIVGNGGFVAGSFDLNSRTTSYMSDVSDQFSEYRITFAKLILVPLAPTTIGTIGATADFVSPFVAPPADPATLDDLVNRPHFTMLEATPNAGQSAVISATAWSRREQRNAYMVPVNLAPLNWYSTNSEVRVARVHFFADRCQTGVVSAHVYLAYTCVFRNQTSGPANTTITWNSDQRENEE